MCPLRHLPGDVLREQDGEAVGERCASHCGYEEVSPRLDEGGAGVEEMGGVGDVFEDFEGGYDVKLTGY
jgi:hypothetical protein